MNQTCTTCLLDTTDPLIKFDSDGVCNYCRSYENVKLALECNIQSSEDFFQKLQRTLKSSRKNKYDSIIGLSGGVDSSYIVLLAKKYNLNPLLVHFDNGWNSEVAVSNIQKLASFAGYDLKTYVINWNEFRDLQRSFVRAGVLDIEMLTDHAIMAALYRISRETGLRNVLSGNNLATEFGMPSSWSWNKQDWTNIKAIHRRYGEGRLSTFPVFPSWKWQVVSKLGWGMNFIEVLNQIPYEKLKAIKELQDSCDWVYYGGKHYESVFTKFYQAYILPKKFNIDKRKAHLSSLIRNCEINRNTALDELNAPIYPDPFAFQNEKEYVLKKLGFSDCEFEEIMSQKPHSHLEFASDYHFFRRLRDIKSWIVPGDKQVVQKNK